MDRNKNGWEWECSADTYLMGVRYQLHRSIVYNHFLEFDARIQFRNLKMMHWLAVINPPSHDRVESYLLATSQKQTIAEFHDVRLVHAGDLLAVVLCGIVECEFCDAQWLSGGDNFQAFHHTINALVFECRIFTFSLFTNNHTIDILSRAKTHRTLITHSTTRTKFRLQCGAS